MMRISLRRWGEIALACVGALLLSLAAFQWSSYYLFQQRPEWFMRPGLRTGSLNLKDSSPPLLHAVLGARTDSLRIAGRLEVPRIGLSVLVVDGDEQQALAVAATHLAESAPLGGPGNSVIAGHRDMAFRALGRIRLGDRVQVKGAKSFNYTVTSLRVVQPDDISVLQSGRKPTLTIITCFPFRYIGDAPQRFVVQAKLNGS